MIFNVNTSIPIKFEASEKEITDGRFTPVTIYLCHTNENLNASFFSKEVMECMVPSLSNIPINGYIDVNSLTEDIDFSGHEQRLVIKDNKLEIEYLGIAYGLIPESNNARFETKLCEDNVEREFLVCDGLLWNKFKDAIDIFNRDGVKSQSMELYPDSIKGYFDKKDKLFHFTSAQIEAACILGTGITPAMTGSTVTAFSKATDKLGYTEMMDEYRQSMQFTDSNIAQQVLQEGGNELDLTQLLAKYSITIEDLVSKEINHEDFSLEDLEEKIKASFAVEDTEEEVTPEPEFALTSNQVEAELGKAIESLETIVEQYWDETYEYARYYYIDNKADSSTVIARDRKQQSIVGFNYSVSGDSYSIDASTAKRYKVDYVPMELDAEESSSVFAMSKEQYDFAIQAYEKHLKKEFDADKSVVVNEVSELKSKLEQAESEKAQFQMKLAEKDAEERQIAENELFGRFNELLSENEVSEIKDNSAQFTLQQIEDALMLKFAKKNIKFSVTQEVKPNRVSIPDETPKSDKPYASLIEQRSKR